MFGKHHATENTVKTRWKGTVWKCITVNGQMLNDLTFLLFMGGCFRVPPLSSDMNLGTAQAPFALASRSRIEHLDLFINSLIIVHQNDMKNLSRFNTRIIIGRTWHNFQVICNANQILLCLLLSRLNWYTDSWEEHYRHDIPSTAILTSNAQLTPWVLQLWKLFFDRGFEGFEPWVSWQLPTNCFNSSLNDSTLSLPSLTDRTNWVCGEATSRNCSLISWTSRLDPSW